MPEQIAHAKSKWPILFLIWLMMLVAYFDRVNVAVAGPTLMADLHLSKTQFGYVLSAFTLGYALLQIPGGWLADKFGSKPLLVMALLIWSIFTGATGLVFSLVSILAVRALFGVGEGIENGAQFKLIGDNFDSKQRSQANAIFLTSLALGPMIATPLATWLIKAAGWRELFYCFAALGILVAALLYFFLPGDASKAPKSEPQPASKPAESPFKQTPTWLCFSGYLLFNAAFWGFIGWIPTYLSSERHLALAKLGFLGALPYLCGFFGMILAGQLGAGKLLDYRPALVACCYLGAALFLYVALTASSVGGCIFGLSASAFFLYGGFGPFWAISIGLTSPLTRGSFTGFVNFGGQIGGFCAQIVIGFLADKYKTFTWSLLFMIAALVLGALCMFVVQSIQRAAGNDLSVELS